MNETRGRSYWIINASSITKPVVFNRITCHKLRGKVGVQITAGLSKDSFQEAAAFTFCTVNMFGPFKIKVKRSEVKRFSAMFTCLTSRAIDIKVSHSMTTDSSFKL